MEYSERNQVPVEEKQTKRAVVNIALVIINAAVWCIMEFFGDTLDGAYIAKYGGMYPGIIYTGEWYRLITSMFLHFGAEHLANNMILLAAAGGKLENAVGAVRYLIIYLGSGFLGNVLSLYNMYQTGDYAVCAGASGAVFGMIGALVWAAVRNRGNFEGLSVKGLLVMTALCMYNGLTTTGVDNWAHAGGAAGGFFLCVLLYRKPQNA